jgi:uncharacterized repeat protein (TIGR01451 family)
MKQFYFFSILILSAFSANAQIINIPDANFKNKLVNTACATVTSTWPQVHVDVDANDDGEIQQTEAAAILSLTISQADIASLEGIQYFTSLTELYCYGSNLTVVDLSNLGNLGMIQITDSQLNSIILNPSVFYLDIHNNQISNLDFVNTLNQLEYLDVSGNLLTGINIDNASLTFLGCDDNLLTTLDVSNLQLENLYCSNNQLISLVLCPEIKELSCSHNQLTSLDLSGMTQLNGLYIGHNLLNSVDIPTTVNGLDISGNLYTSISLPQGQIYQFKCNETQLTSLDLPHLAFGSGEAFTVSNNLHLKYINAKDSAVPICIFQSPAQSLDCPLYISNNPELLFVCTESGNAAAFEYIRENNNPNISFSSYCSFHPGGNYNTITGHVTFDNDDNGCDANDNAAINVPITATNGPLLGITFSNELGNYTVYNRTGNITLTLPFENPYYAVSPTSFTSSFSGFGNTLIADFCIAPNGVHPDLDMSIISINPARPGFDATYKIIYKNKGTETQSGSVVLNFDDAVLDYISATPTVESQSLNTLSWNFTNLVPFESREITFTVNVNSPMEIPPVNNDDLLTFNAQLNTVETDETPADNTFTFSQTVIGSFDPNDKAVSKSVMALTSLDEYLLYTVRFQNTGTAEAENVVVKDMLSDMLDFSTLQMVSSSQPYRATLTSGNKLEFIFEGIELPESSVDEPGSHGYVTFKIKPKSNLVLNDIIENTAEIYFDFNFPVVTNTVSTTVSELGTDDFATVNLSLYPNPVKNILTIELKNDVAVKSVSIFNTLGQLVKRLPDTFEDNTMTTEISDLTTGSYFVQLQSDKGTVTKKLLKL